MWFMFDEMNNGSSNCKMKKLLGHFMKHKPLIYKECLRFSTSCNSIVVGEKEGEKNKSLILKGIFFAQLIM